MTSPTTLHETITMLRRRVQEIDRLIENLERSRPVLRVVSRTNHSRRPSTVALPDSTRGRARA